MPARADPRTDQQPDRLARLLSGYRPLAGIFDEMMDADGAVRPHWQPFLGMLASLEADEINKRLLPPTATCATPASSIASMRIRPASSGLGP